MREYIYWKWCKKELFWCEFFHETLSSIAGADVPEMYGAIPRWREQIVIVIGQGQIADEVWVSCKALDLTGFTKLIEVLESLLSFQMRMVLSREAAINTWVSSLSFWGVRPQWRWPLSEWSFVVDFLGKDGGFFSHHKLIYPINYYFYLFHKVLSIVTPLIASSLWYRS